MAVELVVLHSISLPPGDYRGHAVQQLFTNCLDCDAHPYYERLRGLQVSAHFLLRRSGVLLQFVDVGRRAWHAGASSWRGRDNCNDWSVGIELEGLEGEPFEPVQYTVLRPLLAALARRLPLREVVGHEHIAPGRKADPGAGFDWDFLSQHPDWPPGLRSVAPDGPASANASKGAAKTAKSRAGPRHC